MKTILITGTNGFLGKHTLSILEAQKYDTFTLDIANADYNCDLSKDIPELSQSFDIVFHAAGKAHSIPRTESEKQVFFDVNYKGTINLCKALEKIKPPKAFVFISTVAVYGVEEGEEITEDHPLNGNTPYALSKMQAEEFLEEWCSKNNVLLSILRPSLIAGINPPGNLGAMIKGIRSGRYFNIAGGEARKSIIMAEDIANLLPKLAEVGGIYNLSDGYHPSFFELGVLISSQLEQKAPSSIPYSLAKILALCGDLLGKKAPINSDKLSKIVNSLTFSNQKARKALNWTPLKVLEQFKIQ